MEDRKTRLIYEYFDVEQKQKALVLVQEDKKQLEKELKENFDKYPKIVQRVLSDTLERWQIEIEELTYDIKNNIGSIRPGPFS